MQRDAACRSTRGSPRSRRLCMGHPVQRRLDGRVRIDRSPVTGRWRDSQPWAEAHAVVRRRGRHDLAAQPAALDHDCARRAPSAVASPRARCSTGAARGGGQSRRPARPARLRDGDLPGEPVSKPESSVMRVCIIFAATSSPEPGTPGRAAGTQPAEEPEPAQDEGIPRRECVPWPPFSAATAMTVERAQIVLGRGRPRSAGRCHGNPGGCRRMCLCRRLQPTKVILKQHSASTAVGQPPGDDLTVIT